MRAEMDQMQGEMRRLSGRTEENQHLIKRAVERDLGEQDATRVKVKELSDKMSEMEARVKKREEYGRPDQSAAQEKGAQEQVASKPPEPPKEKPATIEPPKSKEVELYDMALASYKEGKYQEAIDGFKSFLKNYPKSDRADNAYFWIGDSYVGLKQYEQAILAYQEVIKKYPKGNKVPSAMVKQALAFLEIKDKTSAELLFKKVVKNYPGTSEATIAQRKLDAMK
jgi:tol-pal system protein YbgF